MYIVLLRFAENKAKAADLMEAHRAWINKGFEDSVFLLAGSLQPNAGGMLLAHGESPEELQARVDSDPFVAENVVTAEIFSVSPARAEQRLGFLCD